MRGASESSSNLEAFDLWNHKVTSSCPPVTGRPIASRPAQAQDGMCRNVLPTALTAETSPPLPVSK